MTGSKIIKLSLAQSIPPEYIACFTAKKIITTEEMEIS